MKYKIEFNPELLNIALEPDNAQVVEIIEDFNPAKVIGTGKVHKYGGELFLVTNLVFAPYYNISIGKMLVEIRHKLILKQIRSISITFK